jgi:hypothetical protein
MPNSKYQIPLSLDFLDPYAVIDWMYLTDVRLIYHPVSSPILGEREPGPKFDFGHFVDEPRPRGQRRG